jgi:predicted DNA-binding transcriptional regulator YafY
VFSQHGSIYCLGYCHMRRSPRIFHLERMEHLEMLEAAQVARPAGVREHLDQSAVFQTQDSGFSARIALEAGVEGSLAGLLPLRQVEGMKDRPGWKQAQVKVRDSLYFRSVLRGYGPLVEILSPEHLRSSFISDLRQIPLPVPFQLDRETNS